jgi:2,4-dichlorophenol 6-monooxygenase
MGVELTTDVLVIGTGPAGASAALALATYGVSTTAITRYPRLADTPRAHITNQRTMEVLRDFGIEAEVEVHASPQHLMGDLVHCRSLAGEEFGRPQSWGTRPDRLADYTLAVHVAHRHRRRVLDGGRGAGRKGSRHHREGRRDRAR